MREVPSGVFPRLSPDVRSGQIGLVRESRLDPASRRAWLVIAVVRIESRGYSSITTRCTGHRERVELSPGVL